MLRKCKCENFLKSSCLNCKHIPFLTNKLWIKNSFNVIFMYHGHFSCLQILCLLMYANDLVHSNVYTSGHSYPLPSTNRPCSTHSTSLPLHTTIHTNSLHPCFFSSWISCNLSLVHDITICNSNKTEVISGNIFFCPSDTLVHINEQQLCQNIADMLWVLYIRIYTHTLLSTGSVWTPTGSHTHWTAHQLDCTPTGLHTHWTAHPLDCIHTIEQCSSFTWLILCISLLSMTNFICIFVHNFPVIMTVTYDFFSENLIMSNNIF
jgi:hypothetical protein